MFPAEVPAHLRADPFRSAEIEVFEALKKKLPPDFTVFYSRPWLGLTPKGEEIDGEADFVVVHSDWGLLTLEVKGGAITYEATTDMWTTRDRFGFTHIIKNPVAQARTCKYRILEKLGEHTDLPFIRARYGVIFPHSADPSVDLGADKPHEIFCFADRFQKVGAWVEERMGADIKLQGRERPLGTKGIAAAIAALARSFQLSVPAVVDVRREEREIEYLTTEQYWILDFLQNQHRCAIAGPAGTGKTALALEKAIRSAAAGRATLLLCFNRPLANFLRNRSAGTLNLDVYTFHEFVLHWASLAGRCVDNVSEEGLAELLESAGAQLPVRYSCIVVDEGQDFRAVWWAALEPICTASNSDLYVFYDNQQQLYTMPGSFTRLLPQAPFPLTNNLRNSRPIFNAAAPWFGSVAARPLGPDGPPVRWLSTDHLAEGFAGIVSQLCKRDQLAPEQIAVLTPSEEEAERLRRILANYGACGAESVPAAGLICSGIRRYKGLEAAVVILYMPEDSLPEPELLYIGLTRPRSLLIVVARSEIIANLQARLQRAAPAFSSMSRSR